MSYKKRCQNIKYPNFEGHRSSVQVVESIRLILLKDPPLSPRHWLLSLILHVRVLPTVLSLIILSMYFLPSLKCNVLRHGNFMRYLGNYETFRGRSSNYAAADHHLCDAGGVKNRANAKRNLRGVWTPSDDDRCQCLQ